MNDPVTSMTMIERAKGGDDAAWDQLIDTYGPLVHAQCVRKGLQPADARDVSMEVFRSIWQSLDRFKKERKSDRFLHFLRSITSRRIVDHYRGEAKRGDKARGGETDWLAQHAIPIEGELNDQHTNSVWDRKALVQELAREIMKRAATKFKKRTLDVFKRVVLSQSTIKDIAAEFEMSETAVRTNVSRVKKWIKQSFGELPESLRRLDDVEDSPQPDQ